MTDSLREQLARRLAKISEDQPYLDDFDADENPAWGALADEVIRQMEWARINCADLIAPEGTMDVDTMVPLTLAPPEWKPWPDEP